MPFLGCWRLLFPGSDFIQVAFFSSICFWRKAVGHSRGYSGRSPTNQIVEGMQTIQKSLRVASFHKTVGRPVAIKLKGHPVTIKPKGYGYPETDFPCSVFDRCRTQGRASVCHRDTQNARVFPLASGWRPATALFVISRDCWRPGPDLPRATAELSYFFERLGLRRSWTLRFCCENDFD